MKHALLVVALAAATLAACGKEEPKPAAPAAPVAAPAPAPAATPAPADAPKADQAAAPAAPAAEEKKDDRGQTETMKK